MVADKFITLLIIILIGIFKPDYVLIAAYLLIIPYLFLTQRKVLFYHLLLSSTIAIIWMFIAKNEYGYNQDLLMFMGMNLFPLFSWALGLFLVYVIYSHYEHIFQEKSFLKKLALFSLIYLLLLISVETIAYHIFNIKNLVTAAYVGLPICDCIHAPRWIQLSYLGMGPIFFSISSKMGFENPHYKIRIKKPKK